MKLTRVTITGADDSVDPRALVSLSQDFPFVEWGILLSKTQEGGKRFPSERWMQEFALLSTDHSFVEPVHSAGRLCGNWLRDCLKGANSCPHYGLGIFERIQLNFPAERQIVEEGNFLSVLRNLESSRRRIIFQYDGVNTHLLDMALRNGIGAQALFDLSHGAGISPESWPKPLDGVDCGYAGGLGPDNLDEMLLKISDVAGNSKVWIDMETKVRSYGDQVFDLAKVIGCLEIARNFTGRPEGLTKALG